MTYVADQYLRTARCPRFPTPDEPQAPLCSVFLPNLRHRQQTHGHTLPGKTTTNLRRREPPLRACPLRQNSLKKRGPRIPDWRPAVPPIGTKTVLASAQPWAARLQPAATARAFLWKHRRNPTQGPQPLLTKSSLPEARKSTFLHALKAERRSAFFARIAGIHF